MSQLLTHYAFTNHPFGRAISSDTLFRHPGFDEAYSRLRFTVDLHGMTMLVAESGCGKSVLLGQLAAELQRESWTVHYFAHSSVGPFGLVNVLARKVGATPRRSRAETASMLTEILLDSQKNHLLVVDEAHALPDATLEDVRLLTIADFDRKSPFVLVAFSRLHLRNPNKSRPRDATRRTLTNTHQIAQPIAREAARPARVMPSSSTAERCPGPPVNHENGTPGVEVLRAEAGWSVAW